MRQLLIRYAGSVLLLLAPLVPATSSQAEHVLGLDCKGLSAFAAQHPQFDGSRYLSVENSARCPIMPVLDGTFGHDWSWAYVFLAQNRDRFHILEVFLSNGSMRRRPFEERGAGELFPELDARFWRYFLENYPELLEPEIANRVAQIYQALKPKLTRHTVPILTIELEDNLSTKAASNLVAIVRRYWPYLIARNPLVHRIDKPSMLAGADIIESHGPIVEIPVPCIYNEDGKDFDSEKTPVRFRSHHQCDRVAWEKGLQGYTQSNRSSKESRIFTLPRLRPSFTISTGKAQRIRRLLQ